MEGSKGKGVHVGKNSIEHKHGSTLYGILRKDEKQPLILIFSINTIRSKD